MLRIVWVLAALIAAPASAITFDDGLLHVIDAGNSFPWEGVRVYDGPGSTPTTVYLTDGGDVGSALPGSEINGSQNSIVIVDGGSVSGYIQLSGKAVLDMYGGFVGLTISLNSSGTSWISGGQFMSLSLGGVGTLFFSGGTTSFVDRSGGILGMGDTVFVEMSGGTVVGDVIANDLSTLVITAESIGGQLLALGSSAVYVYGVDFNYPPGEIADNSGTLTGILSDGTPINVEFGRASQAVIFLPEPSCLAGLASGVALLMVLAGAKMVGYRTGSVGDARHPHHSALRPHAFGTAFTLAGAGHSAPS